MEALAACHAEMAAHPATGLGRHTKSVPVCIRNHDRFDRICLIYREKILFRAIDRLLAHGIFQQTDFRDLRKLLPSGLGDIGHGLDIPHVALVKPTRYLVSRKFRKACLKGDFLEFIRRLSQ